MKSWPGSHSACIVTWRYLVLRPATLILLVEGDRAPFARRRERDLGHQRPLRLGVGGGNRLAGLIAGDGTGDHDAEDALQIGLGHLDRMSSIHLQPVGLQ